MDPVRITLGIPGVAVLWVLTLVSLTVFGRRVGRFIGALRKARPENRLDRIGERVRLFAVNVLGQRRLLNERIGFAHFLFFWGFVFYASTFWWSLARGLFPFLPVPYPERIGLFATVLDLLGAAVIVSIAAAVIRRRFFPPPHLNVSADAYIILALIGMVMVTQMGGRAFSLSIPDEAHGGWTPAAGAAAAMGAALGGLSARVAETGATAMWWLHMITVLGFLAYLPYSKHMHLLVAPFNVFLGNLRPPGDLGVAGEDEATMLGAREWKEFTWRQLLNALSCAECGRCDRACLCVQPGRPGSPQQMIQWVKEHFYTAGLGLPAPHGHNGNGQGSKAPDGSGANREDENERRAVTEPTSNGGEPTSDGRGESKGNGNGDRKRPLIGGIIPAEALWSCATCYACMNRCPVFNEHIPLIVQMRRALVSEGAIGPSLQEALNNLNRYGNSFGKSPRMRAQWTKGLDFKIKDARKEPVDYLWFVGDYASYDPRLQEATRKTARVFHEAGLDFGLLYDGEHNAGNDVRRVGEEGLFQTLREKNLRGTARARSRAIVTTDPHSYNTLLSEYAISDTQERSDGEGDGMERGNGEKEGNGPSVAARRETVVHSSLLFAWLIEEGRIPIRRPLGLTATYHDPCYLGRYNGVFDPPRDVLRALGVRLIEMRRNRNTSYCCGAGGGRIWMEDAPGTQERPAESRVREAAALPGVATLVVACPKDLVMFQDAVKTTGNEGNLEIKELGELVWEAMRPDEKEV